MAYCGPPRGSPSHKALRNDLQDLVIIRKVFFEVEFGSKVGKLSLEANIHLIVNGLKRPD